MALKDFTLHHHIARPISVHSYPPLASMIQHMSLAFSLGTMGILAWLMHLVYTTLKGASLGLLIIILLPLNAGIILLSFFIYYQTTFRRDLETLEKHHPKFVHSFKHNPVSTHLR